MHLTLSIIGTAALGLAPTVQARTNAEPAPEEAAAGAGEEIIVTAQKRSETASRVGMSIAAFSGETLQKLNVRSAADLVRNVPSLTVTPSTNGTPIFNIRGIAFNTSNASSSSPVGIHVDQIAYAYPVMAAGPIFDIARVEVLKGPQGTLYGRNTTGGLIGFISNQPTRELAGSVTLEGGNYETINNRGFISGPLTATLAGRLSWEVDSSGKGWQKSLTRNDRLGEVSRQAGRAILAWTPDAALKATASFNYWHDGSDTQAAQRAYHFRENAPFGIDDATIQPFLLTAGARNSQAEWTPAGLQPASNTSSPRPAYRKDNEFYAAMLNVEYQVSDAVTLTSLTGYNHYDRDETINNDGTTFEIYSANLTARIKSFSQELRLSGDGGGYNWMVGGYFSDDRIRERQRTFLDRFSTIETLRFVAASLGDPRYTATQIAEGFRVNDLVGKFASRSFSVFANGQVELGSTLKATGGVRFTRDRTRFAGCAADAEGNTVPVWNTAVALLAGAYPAYDIQPGQCMTFQRNAPLPEGFYRDTLKQDNISWRASLDWTPTDRLLFYAVIARGYKSGNYPVIPANRAVQFDPATQEKVTSYEVGSKFRFGPARMTLAAYYNDYHDKQVMGAVEDPIFASLARIVNLPRSETYGAEASFDLTVSQGLSLNASASYIRTKVLRYVGYDAFGELRDFAGAEFPNTPRWQLSGNIAYERPISSSLKLGASVDGSYQSRSHGDFFGAGSYAVFGGVVVNAPIYDIPDYVLVNGSANLARRDDRWKLTAWARNLFNRDYWASAIYYGDGVTRSAGLPRTYGLSLTVSFGR